MRVGDAWEVKLMYEQQPDDLLPGQGLANSQGEAEGYFPGTLSQ